MPLGTLPAVPQRRNVAVLAFAQALFMSIQGMGIAATPLAAYTLLGADEKWLATVPIFLVHLSIMGTTIPASLLMGVIGRRAGFTLGSLLGVAAGGVGCYAMFEQSFPLLCLASVFQGMQAGFFWYFRLAAADAAEPAFRAKAISLVMAGGVIAGFLGPADGQVGGRLAGAGHVRRHLSRHDRLLHRRPGAGAARAHPAAQRGGARGRRPADEPRSCASPPIAWRSPPPCAAMR